MNSIKRFTIHIPEADIQDMKSRLGATHWPDALPGSDWKYGPADSFMRRGAAAWRALDWRKCESELNRFPQFTTEIDGQTIHFLHVRSPHADAVPLLLIHGWPGSFIEFLRVIEPLTNPGHAAGGRAQAFHVVVPSIPGYGFSGPTREAGWNNRRIAQAFLELMSRLNYGRFGVQGADAGAVIAPELGRLAPDRVMGVHVNAATLGFIPLGPISPELLEKFTLAEKNRLQRLQKFMSERFGFNFVQSQRPQSLAYAMADSPIGLLAWLSELFTSFGDTPCAVDLETFLINVSIYWFTRTAPSSMRHYYENAHDPSAWAPKINSGVPTGVAVFEEGDVAIRHFSEEQNRIVRWKEYAKGGHYAVLEYPEIWTADVREFFAELPASEEK
jgi:pimeloyl-ACP methyl ester carboxylesterase